MTQHLEVTHLPVEVRHCVARMAEYSGPIDAELAFFVDVPGALDVSTTGEILARLGEQLDAPYTGQRRISVFSM